MSFRAAATGKKLTGPFGLYKKMKGRKRSLLALLMFLFFSGVVSKVSIMSHFLGIPGMAKHNAVSVMMRKFVF